MDTEEWPAVGIKEVHATSCSWEMQSEHCSIADTYYHDECTRREWPAQVCTAMSADVIETETSLTSEASAESRKGVKTWARVFWNMMD